VLPYVASTTRSRKFPRTGIIVDRRKKPTCTTQSKMITHDQRGANCPVGKTTKKVPNAGHCKKLKSVRGKPRIKGESEVRKTPESVVEMPDEPYIISTSEKNRPIHSRDLRQKIRSPTT